MCAIDRNSGDAAMVAIALLDDYQNVALRMADWSRLQRDHRVAVFNERLPDVEACARALADFEVIGIMRERTPFPRALFERLPKLKLLITTGKRNASVDVAAAKDHKVVVCGTGGGGLATAELAVGLMLALARHLREEFQAMRPGGGWQTTVGATLEGRTLGIVGLGNLGTRVARIGTAIGMQAIAWSENLTAERARERGAERVDKDELFRRADVVSIHTVLSPRTRGLIGARELGLMKPNALLINTSRGPIVDEAALLAALKGGTIAHAGLDVYDKEPVAPGHPFTKLENVTLIPHLGYVVEDSYRHFYAGTIEDIEAWLDGKPINVINPDALKKAA
jgi:phosphoglycerate dehydrogenase-like enzyme